MAKNQKLEALKANTVTVPTEENVTFDFSVFSAKDTQTLMAAQKKGDIEGIANIFAKCVESAPDDWGDLGEAATYAALPLKSHWHVLLKLFSV